MKFQTSIFASNQRKSSVTDVMSFLALNFLLGFLCVTGTPSQLRLSHSGYEIISFNEQNPEDNVPNMSKLTQRNSSHYNRIGNLNLEKVTDSMDDSDDSIIDLQQSNKHNYESKRFDPGSKIRTEPRQNMIVHPSKEFAHSGTRRVYLTVGIPRRPNNLSNLKKDSTSVYRTIDGTDSSPKSKNLDATNHGRETAKREKYINSNNKNKKYSSPIKSKIKSVKNDFEKEADTSKETTKILESENESALDLDGIKALVMDSQSGLDLVVSKADCNEKSEKIETPTVKSRFPVITKFPSIQIHNQRSFWVPPRGPAMFSPIYPSGFDILTSSDTRHKTMFPFSVPTFKDSQNLRFDSNNLSRKVDIGSKPDGQKNEMSHESSDATIRKKEIVKPWQQEGENLRIPSFVIIKNLLDDLSNLRKENHMSLNVAEFLPFSETSLNIVPLTLTNQRSSKLLEGQKTTDSTPLIANPIESKHQRHTENFSSFTEPEKTQPRANDVHRKFFNSKIDRRYHITGSKSMITQNLLNKPNTTTPHRDLVIDIVQEMMPEDYESTYIDLDNDNSEIQDGMKARDLFAPEKKCKKMRNLGDTGFYEFLETFSDIVIEKALRYESNLHSRDHECHNASKPIDVSKKSNDNEIFHRWI